ncbi:MAG: hypothetical protein PHU35_02830 [Bacteroidales bacterium]|nr:hypothetical protein [Bacteroidales bacterium]MDD4528628.1 hypothetical protein [Bacteroidales bacterium]
MYILLLIPKEGEYVGYAHCKYAGEEVYTWTEVTLSIHYYSNETPYSVSENFTPNLYGFAFDF